jgi:ElaB/YqjD/DUF883 family membrane-anchored ribosome-binding protein
MMTAPSENPLQTAEAVLGDLRFLVEEAEKIASQSKDIAPDDLTAALRDRYEVAQERLALFARERPPAFAGIRAADQAIRAHPYHALGFGLGVGLLVGLLFGRRAS